MNIKSVYALISTLINILAFMPYLRDVWKRKTKPHEFTWLIWCVTQGITVAALLHGGIGIVGVIPLSIGALLAAFIFLLSLRDGEKNITRSDILALSVALAAMVVWWLLDNPLLSVVMVTAIDVVGYIPTFRKSYVNPWSETVSSWGLFSLSNVFAILALNKYNLLTLNYLASISFANLSLSVFLLLRRRTVSKL